MLPVAAFPEEAVSGSPIGGCFALAVYEAQVSHPRGLNRREFPGMGTIAAIFAIAGFLETPGADDWANPLPSL
jgi:hypothetical protein